MFMKLNDIYLADTEGLPSHLKKEAARYWLKAVCQTLHELDPDEYAAPVTKRTRKPSEEPSTVVRFKPFWKTVEKKELLALYTKLYRVTSKLRDEADNL